MLYGLRWQFQIAISQWSNKQKKQLTEFDPTYVIEAKDEQEAINKASSRIDHRVNMKMKSQERHLQIVARENKDDNGMLILD